MKDDGTEYTRADITVTHKLWLLLVWSAAILLTHTAAPHSVQSTVSCWYRCHQSYWFHKML